MRQLKNPILLSFGNQVRSYRRRCQFSQEELAELSGLDRTYISGIERGVRNPTLLVVDRISSALNVSSHELLIPVDVHLVEENLVDKQNIKPKHRNQG